MKKSIITAILSFAFLLGGLASANAATLTVTKIADTNDNVCDADCSLREAIFAAASGDTIEFAASVFNSAQTITLGFGELAIDKTLTVNGKGANLTTFSGNNANRIFHLYSNGNLTLNNLTVTGGRDDGIGDDFGGGIFNEGILAINNSSVSGNTVGGNTNTSFGGGIYNHDNSSMTMVNSTVSGNSLSRFTTDNRGAGIYNAANTTVSITGSTVSGNAGNSIRDNYGVGIYNQGTMTVTGSTISGNTVNGTVNTNHAGGIYNTGAITLINSTISGNTAISSNFSSGGGIYNTGTVTIINGTVTRNTASSTFSRRGGGIASFGGTLRVVNTIISGNTCPIDPDLFGGLAVNVNNFIGGDARLAPLSNYGGAAQTHALLANSPAINTGSNCVLTENGCGFNHPALTNEQRGAGFPRLFGATVDIGAVENGNPIVFTFSPASLPPAVPNVAYSQQIIASGTAPHTFALDSGTLPTGITLSNAGLISGTTSQIGTFNFTIRATDVNNFSGVKSYTLLVGYYVRNADSSGAGSLRQLIQETPAGGTIRFGPIFFNVPRTIEMDGANLVVNKNLTISGPGANLLTLDGENATQLFSISNVTLNLSGTRLTRGFATFNGGAVVLSGGILNAAGVQIDGSRAANKGGGIALFGGTLNLSNSVITGNSSGVEGGGIRLEPGSRATITNSTVSNNSTDTETGGAIAGFSAQFEMIGSTMSGNRAPNGGAVFMGGSSGGAVINNSTVSGNTATTGRGGAVLIVDATYLNTTNTTITNNKSKNNQTGGIFVESPAAYNTRNTIIAGNCNQNDELDCRSTSTSGNPDVRGVITGFGYNLLGNTTGNSYAGNTTGNLVGAANLAPLGNYGGTTQTHALLPNSQAINAGDPDNSFTTDQRGSTRPIGGRGDIGSFERNIVFDQSTLPNGTQSAAYNQTLTITRLTSLADNQVVEPFAEESNPANFAPFTFAIISIAGQSLPTGLILSPSGQILGTPTNTGSFTFTVKVVDGADGISGVQQYTMQILAPTAANVSISGRVSTASGNGLTNAIVVLTNANGETRTVRTTSFGYFKFDEVEAGQIVVISVISKRFQFAPQVITVNEEITGLNLTANE